jgi:hypothetical protein
LLREKRHTAARLLEENVPLDSNEEHRTGKDTLVDGGL